MKVFVSPFTDTAWSVQPDALAAAISRQFNEAVIRKKTEGGHSLEWTIGSQLEGSLDISGNTVVLDGDIVECARFAVWYRKHVPSSQSLLFYDESYSADVTLSAATTIDELIAPFVIAKQ